MVGDAVGWYGTVKEGMGATLGKAGRAELCGATMVVLVA